MKCQSHGALFRHKENLFRQENSNSYHPSVFLYRKKLQTFSNRHLTQLWLPWPYWNLSKNKGFWSPQNLSNLSWICSKQDCHLRRKQDLNATVFIPVVLLTKIWLILCSIWTVLSPKKKSLYLYYTLYLYYKHQNVFQLISLAQLACGIQCHNSKFNRISRHISLSVI